MMNEAQKNKSSWLTEGIVIAGLTVFSYTIAFVFEAGIADHFGIPFEFIEVSLTGIFVAFITLLTGLLIIYVLLEILNPLWVKLSDAIRRRLRLYFGFFFAIIGSLIIAGGSIASLKIILIWFIVMVFIDFIIPALSRKKGKSYVEKVQESHEADLQYDTFFDKLIQNLQIDTRTFKIILFLIFVIFLSFYSGLGKARKQKEFLVLQSDKNQVVLRKYGDIFITTKVDRDKKELTKTFSVYRFDPGKSFSFKTEMIGPLKTEKSENKGIKANTGK